MFRLEDCVAYLASRNTKELADTLEKRLLPAGITRVKWMALYYISKDEEITQKQLAEHMGSKEPTVVRLIDRLERDELVYRVQKDRRTNIIRLTDKGNEYCLRGMEITEKFKDDAVRGISAEEQDLFIKMLDKMVENTK